MNTDASWPSADEAAVRVLEIQAKLHRWAKGDPDRCFADLFNLVVDPAFLQLAWIRVSGNRGARSAGIDGVTARSIRQVGGEQAMLAALRHDLKSGRFAPLAVRGRMIPKASGKLRRLGIPSVRDRVAQAALKLVLEPIFEADFKPSSYGFRPRRRAHDALAEIHFLANRSYEWVFEADIEACFDTIDHTALLGQVSRRVGDRRVLRLVKAFLKAGLLTEDGQHRETLTGTPQGGILSPLLANIALSQLDEYFAERWAASGTSATRTRLRRRGGATYRLVRYADDFVVMVAGSEHHAHALRAEVEAVLAPIGLRLSDEKTSVLHIDEGFDFLGFRIQRRHRRGTSRRSVYIYPSKKALASIIGKIRDLTRRSEHPDLEALLRRVNAVLRGWSAYFALGASAQTLSYLHQYTWRRVVVWIRKRHHGANWATLRRRYLPGWWPTADGVRLFSPHLEQRVIRIRWRGEQIPTPWNETG